MNERLLKLRDETLCRNFRKFRLSPVSERPHWAFSRDEVQNVSALFALRCREERPIVLPDERICFMRSRTALASCCGDTSPGARLVRRILSVPGRVLHRLGLTKGSERVVDRDVSNTSPDHALFLRDGLNGRIAVAQTRLAAGDPRERPFLLAAIDGLNALKDLVARTADEARRVGNVEMAEMLARVPAEPPKTFHEALQSLRILQFAFYLHGSSHCGWGRMDQYLIGFYRDDLAAGRLTREAAKELLEEFFIALNRDADLYPGIQQGDNGQSLMLGGCRPEDGTSATNELTSLVIEAVLETRLIDPKINLRVDRNTPTELLELGSELTKCGLGFPQYSNDEVVIPALVRKGYSLADARDYSVAACWEFVIPGRSLDMVNVAAVSFPAAVDAALRESVAKNDFTVENFRRRICGEIDRQVAVICSLREVWHPAPFLSAFFDGALESGKDITEVAPYRNLGIHGAGAANAADAVTNAEKVFATEGAEGLRRLVSAEDGNFADDVALRDRLLNEMPKIGNADAAADGNLSLLFDAFADAADRYSTPQRRIRPGSGSAMYYVWLTDTKSPRAKGLLEPVVGATADGRLCDAPLASSLAPAHEARVRGILSVLKSFSVIDYSRIMNGGPITIEFSPSVFRTPDGVRDVAQLVRYFVSLGEQQLQLNVLDVAAMEDALVHPERHRNLVVRVWGWSGYFCELDPAFQQQIIRRHRYGD